MNTRLNSPAEFDAYYLQAREALLLETFALTGDLSASRSAVRDALAVTWHHWRKANRTGDPLSWTRPLAWRRAQRRHQTHIWHREKGLDPEVVATLSALSGLRIPQRKALLLRRLTTLSVEEVAPIVGLTAVACQHELALAEDEFTAALEITPDQIATRFAMLGTVTEAVTWPRPNLVRRMGGARRRSHTFLGVALAAAGLVAAGSLVTVGAGPRSVLDRTPASATTAKPTDSTVAEPELLDEADLLTLPQVQPLVANLNWREALTTDNSGDQAVLAPCQPERYADVDGLDTYIRVFEGTGPKQRSARVLQSVELSRTEVAAQQTFKRVQEWYGGCTTPRTQLLATEKVDNVGAEAYQFDLRSWGKKPETMTVTVARTGRLTLTVIAQTRNLKQDPSHLANAHLLAAAVNGQCGSAPAGVCAGPPSVTATRVPSLGEPVGMLKEVDLPPVKNAVGPWSGTEPKPATQMLATARCATTRFTGKDVSTASTRTFLFPKMAEERQFGLTQTNAVMTKAAATSFVTGLRKRLAACADSEPGTTVTVLHNRSDKNSDQAIWRLTTDLGEGRTSAYLLAVVREGKRVSQIGFVPSTNLTISHADFTALAARAAERLPRYRG